MLTETRFRNEEEPRRNISGQVTDAKLDKIQDKMNELQKLMERLLNAPTTNKNTPHRPDELTLEDPEDPSLDVAQIESLTASLASKCIDVATSVCDKISRSASTVNQDPSVDGGGNTEGFGINNNVSGTGTAPSRQAQDIPPRRIVDPGIEKEEVLIAHIDNNERMALDEIKANQFGDAQPYILRAISNSELRELQYGCPFDNRSLYMELHAFVLRKIRRISEARAIYESLLKSAEENGMGDDTIGRLRYSLALAYQDEYSVNRLGEEDDALFEPWMKNGVIAFNCAMNRWTHGGHRGNPNVDEPWRSCPSVRQAAKLLYDMYVYWKRTAEAESYRQLYLNSPEASRPYAIPSQPPHRMALEDIPTPPTSVSTESRIGPSMTPVVSNSAFENNRLMQFAATKGIFAPIHENNYELAKFILETSESSFNINQLDEEGRTPLLLAAERKDIKMVEILLQSGLDPDIKVKSRNGYTVLHYALLGPGGYKLFKLLVSRGADINAIVDQGTPLHFAVKQNNIRAAEMLLEKKVDLEAKDSAMRTPLVVAMQLKKENMVELLTNEGASLAAYKDYEDSIAEKFDKPDKKYRRVSTTSESSTRSKWSIRGKLTKK